jgi:hypothetical protein
VVFCCLFLGDLLLAVVTFVLNLIFCALLVLYT